jgi:hypothetical protein
MTKSVGQPPIPAPRACLQFTLRELLLFVTLTFLGMLLFVPLFGKEMPGLGCALVIASTAMGSLLGMFCCRPDSPRRKRWLCAGVLFSWMSSSYAGFIISLLVRDNSERAIAIGITLMPLMFSVCLTFFRSARAERCGWNTRPSIPITLLSFSVLVLIPTIAIPSLLRNRTTANETAPAAACKAFAEAEEIYHRMDYANAGTLQYATSLQILLGKNGELALIDKTMAQAEIGHPQMAPKAGYYFKVLLGQGPSATGGRRTYIDENGHMTRGYAIIATPAKYDVTGRDCFMINNNGTIFQNDLGEDTAYLASAMTEFNPDATWVPTQ